MNLTQRLKNWMYNIPANKVLKMFWLGCFTLFVFLTVHQESALYLLPGIFFGYKFLVGEMLDIVVHGTSAVLNEFTNPDVEYVEDMGLEEEEPSHNRIQSSENRVLSSDTFLEKIKAKR